MIQFYEEYNQELTMVKSIAQLPVAQLNGNAPSVHKNTITQPPVAQLPEYNFSLPIRHIHWTHNVILMQRVKDINKPIGISDYELGQALPRDLRSSLPSIEDIEAEFDKK